MRSPGLFGEKAFSRRGSGGTGLADGVAAAALEFEGTAAGAGGVASDGGGLGRFRWDDLGDAEVLVKCFDGRLEENGGALRLDEFGDLDGGPEANGGGGVLVAQDLSKSVDGEVSQVAEFVHNAVGALLAEGEAGAGEVGEGPSPEVDGGAVNAGFFGGGGDREARDEALEHLDLNRRQGVELR